MHPDAARTAEIVVPAEPAYLTVVRMAASSLAARQDFDLDAVEDLRMAIGEAGSLAVGAARPGDRLHVGFAWAEDRISVEVSLNVVPDDLGFAWQVLQSLAPDAVIDPDASGPGGRLCFSVGRSGAAL